MSVGRRLLRGSLLRNLDFLVTVLVTLVMSPIIVHSLGDRMYGFWSLVATFVGYYGLLDFGLTSAVGRFVARGIGRDDPEEVSAVASTSFVLMLGVGAASLVVTLAAAAFCGFFIHDPEEAALFRRIILLMGLSIAWGFPVRVYGGILTAHLRYDFVSAVSITRAVVSNILIYLSLGRGHGLLALTLINISASLLNCIAVVLYCRKVHPEIRVDRAHFERRRVRELLDYSGKTFVGQLADILRFRINSLVIAGFLNLSLVTYYTIGTRLMDYFVQFIVSSVGILTTLYSQHEGRGDMDAVRATYERATKVCVVLAVFVGLSIAFYGKQFIRRWMGPGFESSYYVTLILAVGYIPALMQSTSVNLLYGISRQHYFAVANLAEGIATLLLSVVLVNWWGIYGVALSTAISMTVVKLLVQPLYTCRAIAYPVRAYYGRILLGTFLKTALPLAAFFLVVRQRVEPEYSSIMTYAVLQLALYAPVAYFLVFGPGERKALRLAVLGRT